ncbi:hypothetical protein QUF58_07610 [Anaerolineales bacterium HSG24]|nr:hypothetical protein [Anaerolineales bacterium HSG24]
MNKIYRVDLTKEEQAVLLKLIKTGYNNKLSRFWHISLGGLLLPLGI